MSIGSDLMNNFPDEISTCVVNKTDLHGEDAVEVIVGLHNGLQLTGTFAKHPREGFGGVQFSHHKDIVGLMTSKINAVLDGKADLSG